MKTVVLALILLLSGCNTADGPTAAGPMADEPTADGQTVDGPSPVELLRVDPPAAPGSMAPEFVTGPGGVLLTWLEKGATADQHQLRMARWRDGAWGPAVSLVEDEGFFANWADRPSVIETEDGTLLAYWLGMLGQNTYDYGVRLIRSTDGGGSWQDLGLLHDDETPAEHGFVTMVVLRDTVALGDAGALQDAVQAFWLDGRAMPAGGDMQLRTVRLDAEQGYAPGSSTVLDERICECCSTDAALTSAGPIVAYRDRDAGEIRDIAVVRGLEGRWSTPRIVAADDWQIHGCPVNGPALAARGERVVLAWFSAPQGRSRVRVAFSGDAGATFGPPIEIDAEDPLGRVDVELDEEGHALVSWLGARDGAGEIRLRRVSAEGGLEPARVLVHTTTQRSAGVPRLVRSAGPANQYEFLLGWVETGSEAGGATRVRAGRWTGR